MSGKDIEREEALEKRTPQRQRRQIRIFSIFMLYLLFAISFNGVLLISSLLDEAKAQAISGQGDGTLEVYCDGKPCNNTYEGGSTITIRAVPNKTSRFVKWSGMCNHTEPICQFTMPNREAAVTAHFEPLGKKKKKKEKM